MKKFILPILVLLLVGCNLFQTNVQAVPTPTASYHYTAPTTTIPPSTATLPTDIPRPSATISPTDILRVLNPPRRHISRSVKPSTLPLSTC
jgi:hypothetical protein